MADRLRERALAPATLEHGIAQIAAGRIVIVLDQDGMRARGVLTVAAEHMTDRHIAFMTRQAGGFLCLALTPERCDELGLPSMAGRRVAEDRTRFTVTIEAREGVTTGISAADQAHTMRTAADPSHGRNDLVVPGHVRPCLRGRAPHGRVARNATGSGGRDVGGDRRRRPPPTLHVRGPGRPSEVEAPGARRARRDQ